MEYKVTEKDLIGEIKDFPIEVVQKMIEMQVEQGNKADVTVFQKYNFNGKNNGGFDWEITIDGRDFWENIIRNKNFVLFFKKYPKQKQIKIEKDMETNKLILNGITLPKGTEAKVSVEDGATIITFQKQEEKEPEFKDGDIIYSQDDEGRGLLSIFNRIEDDVIYSYAYFSLEDKIIFLSKEERTCNFGSMDELFNIRLATKEEVAEFNKEFADQKHLKWNAKEFKFEEYRWRAEKGGKFWFITSSGEVDYAIDNYAPIGYMFFNSRNYFQTEELAKKAQPLWKDFFKNLSL